MNKSYELTLILDPNLADTDVNQQLAKIAAIAEQHEGKIENTVNWGRRDIAYPINKKTQGVFLVLVVSGNNTLVSDLNRQLKINDAVLRSLIVVKDKYAPDAKAVPDFDVSKDARGEDGVPGVDGDLELGL